MKYTFVTAICWSLLSSLPLMAQLQPTVELDEIIGSAIANNFNIKIAKNNIEVASNTATIGAAGWLPTADIGANYTYSNNNSTTKFSGSIPDQDVTGAESQNYGANVNLRYTLFDGLKPLYTLKKSQMDVRLMNTQYKQSIENTIYSVLQAYYNLAALQEDYRITAEKMALTQIQLRRIEKQREYGQGSEVERLNLQTSYNTDSTQLLRILLGKKQAVRQLNKAIGAEDLDENTQVVVDTELDLNLNYESILDAAQQNNLALLKANQTIEKAKIDYQLISTELYPKLNTTISYGYSGSQNDAGIVASNSSLGLTVNLGLTYTIYSGGQLRPARQNAQLSIKNAELNLDFAQYDLEQTIKDAWVTYENNMALIPIEQGNVAISKKSFDRTATAYELGQVSYLSYQQAEFNYLQAQRQVITARYNAKLAEWELRRISGQLIK